MGMDMDRDMDMDMDMDMGSHTRRCESYAHDCQGVRENAHTRAR